MRPHRATIVVLAAALLLALAPGAAAAAPLLIKIEGNHFVNGEGQAIRLLGVNHPSFEYACVQGWGLNDGHMDAADAAAVAAWNANAVRVPLNEDCWLGTAGQPSGGFSAAEYQAAVESYVAALNAHGLYAILDLHWTAPAARLANGQQPMPDAHSVDFWSSVAATFRDDPAVVFDLFNEPFSPGDPRSGDDPAHPVSWSCWVNGGCTVPYYSGSSRTATTYTAVGMQGLLNAVRGAGATQPVLLGGLDYANDLSGWLANAPTEPLGQEAASFHNYQGKECDDPGCWNGVIASVASQVPVVTGEFDEDVCAPTGFDAEYMNWADAHGVGYLAWGWWVLSGAEIAEAGCSAYYLLTDWDGTAASPNGTNLRDHLLGLPPGGRSEGGAAAGGATPGSSGSGGGANPSGKVRLTHFAASVVPGGASISFRIAASQTCSGKIAGRTIKAFRVGGHKAKPVALGSTKVSLTAGRTTTVTMKLSGKARGLLKAKGPLPSTFTVTLGAGSGAPTVLHPTATLTEPKPKKHHRH